LHLPTLPVALQNAMEINCNFHPYPWEGISDEIYNLFSWCTALLLIHISIISFSSFPFSTVINIWTQ
jgi:hypothetical protein